MKKTYYYHSFDEDLIKNPGQNYKLPANYNWLNDGKAHTILFRILYIIAKFIAHIYCFLFLHIQFVGRKNINKHKGKGCFVYANHTQTFGDVIIPLIAANKHRVAIIASPANLGIPIIGKLLPGLGAIPIPSNRKQMNEFLNTLKILIDRGYCIFIYPEAHVWPYYTDIRPFSTSSFHYPIEFDTPVFCMTMTYQKQKNNHPKVTCYIDECHIPIKNDIKKRVKRNELHNLVFNTMKARSSKSDYQYYKYIKVEEEN